jgi:mannose/fructose/N-acetylgalactosamine-specific phosphotransferase system component IIB
MAKKAKPQLMWAHVRKNSQTIRDVFVTRQEARECLLLLVPTVRDMCRVVRVSVTIMEKP